MTLEEEAEAEAEKKARNAKKAREKNARESYERVLAKHGLLKKYDDPEELDKKTGKIPKNIHWYFNSIPDFKDISYNGNILNIIIFYICMRIERAHRKILYCDMIKRHKINKKITDEYLDNLRLYGDRFFIVYKELLQKPDEGIVQTAISAETIALIKKTKDVRNKVIHGDEVRAISKTKEKAICTLLDYAERLNEEVLHISGFRPFGDLTNFGKSYKNDDESRAILAPIKARIDVKLNPKKRNA